MHAGIGDRCRVGAVDQEGSIMRVLLIAAVISAMFAGQAHATDRGSVAEHVLSEGFTTPQQLLFDCTASAETHPYLMAHCRGLVEGIWQTDALFPSHRICAPPDITIGQAVSVVVEYIRKNPASLFLDLLKEVKVPVQARVPVLVAMALNDAWPCK